MNSFIHSQLFPLTVDSFGDHGPSSFRTNATWLTVAETVELVDVRESSVMITVNQDKGSNDLGQAWVSVISSLKLVGGGGQPLSSISSNVCVTVHQVAASLKKMVRGHRNCQQ